jgi:hypothetical protein
MSTETKKILLIAVTAVLINTFLWLDSVDNYLNAQYHVTLSEYLPDALFKPSIALKKIIPKESPKATAEQSNSTPSNSVVASKSMDSQSRGSANQKRDGGAAEGQVRILFAGDSMMQGVAPLAISSLRKIYSDAYFEDLSKQSTGLTVNRYLDWPETIKAQIAQKNFHTVVIFLGPNDPWDIVEGKQRYKFPSPEWENKYRSRVKEVLDYASTHKVKIIWIGLSSMRDDRLQKGAVIQNKVFKEEMHSYGFTYIPTEDLFGGLDQPFKNYIYDASGKELVVRASDGTHYSPQGLRMISSKLVTAIAGADAK